MHVDGAVLRYVAELADATRQDQDTRLGVSVRGALAMIRLAKVWAAAQGRHYVIPDDVKVLSQPTWAHRLVMDPEAEFAGVTQASVIQRVLGDVPAPQNRAERTTTD